MLRIFALLLAVVLLAVVEACPQLPLPASSTLRPRPLNTNEKIDTTVTWSQTDSKANLARVTPGATMEIVFHANPTTGYSWLLVPPGSSEIATEINKVLEFRDCRYVRTPAAKTLVGSGGHEHWYFTMSNTTRPNHVAFQLEFTYTRPWVDDDPESKDAVIRIVVV